MMRPSTLLLVSCLLSCLTSTAAFTSVPVSKTESKCRRQRWHHASTIDTIHQAITPNDDQSYSKLPRLYVDSSTTRLSDKQMVTLSPEQTHYLLKVMRFFKKRKQNAKHNNLDNDEVSPSKVARDCVRLFNGQDGEWLAKVIQHPPLHDGSNRKKRQTKKDGSDPLQAECWMELRPQPKNTDRPWIIFASIKNQSRMKLMIEKCTELGVGGVLMVKSDRMDGAVLSSMSKVACCDSDGDNLDVLYGTKAQKEEEVSSVDKLRLQAVEAAEQCERLSVPCITTDLGNLIGADTACDYAQGVLSIREMIELWRTTEAMHGSESRKLLICRERGEKSTNVMPVLDVLRHHKKVAFVVGPEGGWSPEEEALFDDVCNYANSTDSPVQCVSLGSSVLRAETACMTAVGAWSLVHN